MTSLQLKFWRLHEVCDVSKNLHFTWSKASIHEGPNVCLCGAPLKVFVTWSHTMNQCILSDTHWQKSVLSISILWHISHTHQQLRKQYVYFLWWSMNWIFAYDWHGKWISGSSFFMPWNWAVTKGRWWFVVYRGWNTTQADRAGLFHEPCKVWTYQYFIECQEVFFFSWLNSTSITRVISDI